MIASMWFNVAVCDEHWKQMMGDRVPVRLKEEFVRDEIYQCAKCGEPLKSPIFIRASWKVWKEDEQMKSYYYTFGVSHRLNGEYAVVNVHNDEIDPRLVFASWLGSYDFASEYTQEEWEKIKDKNYKDKKPLVEITVEENS